MHTTDPFLFQLFVIFVWAKLFGEIFERLHLPAVLGEILAGVLIGPYGAALVLPASSIFSIAEIGAIFLLFTVGLETQPKDLLSVGRTSLYVALAGITVPFVFGFFYMLSRDHAAHEATFAAAAMVATSVGITARVLDDMHVLHTIPARIILGAAVFDDILGMILLGVVVGMVSTTGSQWAQLLITAIEAVGFAVLMLFYAPRLVKRTEPGLQRMSTHHRPGNLHWPLLCGSKDRHGRDYWCILCGIGVCGVLATMESSTQGLGHQRIPGSIFLFQYGSTPQSRRL